MATRIGSCYAESQVSTAGKEVSRTYDGRNRVLTVTYPDGSSSTSFGYDPDGVLASQTDQNGGTPVSTSYAHDKRRLLTFETTTVPNAPSFKLGYSYDANGHLTSTTYPDGRSVGYAPNALGQPTQAGPYATGATYYPDGATHSFTFGNGLVHTMTENTRLLPSRVTDAYGGTAVNDDGYIYDDDGDVGTITDYTAGSIGNGSMIYDGLDRLNEADSPMFGGDNRAVYTYDVLDNLSTARVGSGTSYGYVYDTANHLHELTNATTGAVIDMYNYDAQGNLASKNSQVYQFDIADRLRSAPGLGSYLYDAAGRRVQKTETASGRLLDSMYNQDGRLVLQWEPATLNVTDYIYIGDSLIARVSASKTPITLSMSRSVVNVTSTGATLTVDISNPSATGTVTFTENGTFLGSTSVSGGQAIIILEGLSYGGHTITASYLGDGADWAQTTTFTIRAENLSWLPAVLKLLLQ
jgi:YD repeat-containing protein